MVKLLLSALRWAGVFGLNLGGGGGGKTPKSTTQTIVSDVPEYARGYVKETLAKGMELTDQPYEAYGGNRLAGFSDLQNQSFAGAQNLGVAPQIGQATTYATEAGNYSPVGQQYTGANVNQYMNPYLQGALAPQLREAATAGMMAQQQNASKAVGMGAFGGSRGALQKSLTEKNTMQNMADINARGYSDAFNQAANMFNVDQQRRIQEAQFGTNAKLSSAAQLGQLGQLQFNQGLSAAELQNKFGAQQQGQTQRGLDIAYDDFNREKNFDYEQIMRRSDLLRSVPSGSSSTTSMYGSRPSNAQNLAAAGTAVYGASQLFARGGLAYAAGGITSDENVAAIVPTLSNAQLEQAYAAAVAMGDPERVRVIAEEMQKRGVGVEGGTGQAALPAITLPQEVPEEQIAPNSISAMANPDMVDNIVPTQASMANGGIVAFEEGGPVDAYLESPGIPEQYRRVALRTADAFDQFDNLRAPTPLTPEQRRAAILKERDEMRDLAGPSPYAPMREKLAAREAKIKEQDKKGLGIALLGASGELLKGGSLAEGLSGALPKFAGEYGQNLKESSKQRDALEEYQYFLADAEYKQSIGDIKGAQESIRAAEAAKLAAFREERTTLLNRGTVGAKLAQALRPIGRGLGSGSGSGTKERKLPELTAYANFEDLKRINAKLPIDQQRPEAELWKEATNAALLSTKMSDIPPGGTRAEQERAKLAADITSDEEAQVSKMKIFNPAWQEAAASQDAEGMAAAERAILKELRSRKALSPVNPNSGESGTVSKTAPPGSTLGKTVSGKGREVLDASGKLIGYVKG